MMFAENSPADRLPIKSYTTADGLPRDYISRIVQDSRGFLWFCTIEGISRFDGYGFRNYGIEAGLPSRYVNDFLETRDGAYWVATNAGLCRFDPRSSSKSVNHGSEEHQRFVRYRAGESDDPGAAVALFEDHNGTVWFGGGVGLYQLDLVNGQWELSPTDVIPAVESVQSIAEDHQGSLWVLTAHALYRRRQSGSVERYAAAEGLNYLAHFGALLADRDGVVWLG